MLGVAGGELGVAVAVTAVQGLSWLSRDALALWQTVSIGGREAAVAAGLSILGSRIFGLGPALQQPPVDAVEPARLGTIGWPARAATGRGACSSSRRSRSACSCRGAGTAAANVHALEEPRPRVRSPADRVRVGVSRGCALSDRRQRRALDGGHARARSTGARDPVCRGRPRVAVRTTARISASVTRTVPKPPRRAA